MEIICSSLKLKLEQDHFKIFYITQGIKKFKNNIDMVLASFKLLKLFILTTRVKAGDDEKYV